MKASPKRMGRPTELPPKPASFLLRLPPDLLHNLRTYAGSKGKSANEIIWKALAAFWEKQPRQVRDAVASLRTELPVENSANNTAGKSKIRG